jgi:hypothetical protein
MTVIDSAHLLLERLAPHHLLTVNQRGADDEFIPVLHDRHRTRSVEAHP